MTNKTRKADSRIQKANWWSPEGSRVGAWEKETMEIKGYKRLVIK